jgi:hypothetical protein
MAVSAFNIYPEIGYPEVIRDFSQFLQANARIVPLNLTITQFIIRHHAIVGRYIV